MWTPEDRALVGDFGSGQALSDDQYRLIEPFLPPAKPGGRPRTTDMRRMLDGLFYVVRTGCQWRHVPPPPAFPPWQTIYGYFRAFLKAGVWETIRHHLVMMLREQEGREASPTAAIIDTPSVKTTEKGGPRGGACPQAGQRPDLGDAAKKINGLPSRRRGAANAMLQSIPWACCWASSSMPPISRACPREGGECRQRRRVTEEGQTSLLLAQGRVRRPHLRPHHRPDRLFPARPDADHRPPHRRNHRLRRAAEAVDR
jgi:transposase